MHTCGMSKRERKRLKSRGTGSAAPGAGLIDGEGDASSLKKHPPVGEGALSRAAVAETAATKRMRRLGQEALFFCFIFP